MKKNIKIFLYVFTAVSAFILIVSAVAGEKLPSFPDVPEGSPFYDSVVYFSSRGIVSGQKDGLFYPEEEMTTQEWRKILSSLGKKYESDSDSALSPGDLYASIWETAGVKAYSASEYGYVSDLDAGTTAMLVTRLIQEEAIGQNFISRGEALRLLYEIAVKKDIKEISPTLVDFFEISVGEDCSKDVALDVRSILAKFPNSQLAMLLAYNYKFVVLTDLGLAPGCDSGMLGHEDSGDHIIYLKDSAVSQVLSHEVGHAIETCNVSYSKTWELYKNEGEPGVKLMGSYAGTGASEYIAEATRYFIDNSSNAVAMEKMRDAVPKTYEHLAAVMNNKPKLTEQFFIETVCES